MKLSFKTKQKGLPYLKTAARVANVIQRRRPQRHSHHVGDNHNYGTTGDGKGGGCLLYRNPNQTLANTAPLTCMTMGTTITTKPLETGRGRLFVVQKSKPNSSKHSSTHMTLGTTTTTEPLETGRGEVACTEIQIKLYQYSFTHITLGTTTTTEPLETGRGGCLYRNPNQTPANTAPLTCMTMGTTTTKEPLETGRGRLFVQKTK